MPGVITPLPPPTTTGPMKNAEPLPATNATRL
jgi:hypothetical protein